MRDDHDLRQALGFYAFTKLRSPKNTGGVTGGAICFVRWVIEEKLDPAFFTVPASSTGKYHPDFANGDGGLVRHTVAVVEIADTLGELHEFTARQRSIVVIAALLHDACKYAARVGVERWGAYSTKPHGEIAFLELSENWLPEYRSIMDSGAAGISPITDEDAESLAIAFEGVRDHMVQWAAVTGAGKPVDRSPVDRPLPRFSKARGAVRVVAIADYLASRREFSIELPSPFTYRPTSTYAGGISGGDTITADPSIADAVAEEFAIEGGALDPADSEYHKPVTAEELLAESSDAAFEDAEADLAGAQTFSPDAEPEADLGDSRVQIITAGGKIKAANLVVDGEFVAHFDFRPHDDTPAARAQIEACLPALVELKRKKDQKGAEEHFAAHMADKIDEAVAGDAESMPAGGGWGGLPVCHSCKGSGKSASGRRCRVCKGTGAESEPAGEPCVACEGTGQSSAGGACRPCDGTGVKKSA